MKRKNGKVLSWVRLLFFGLVGFLVIQTVIKVLELPYSESWSLTAFIPAFVCAVWHIAKGNFG